MRWLNLVFLVGLAWLTPSPVAAQSFFPSWQLLSPRDTPAAQIDGCMTAGPAGGAYFVSGLAPTADGTYESPHELWEFADRGWRKIADGTPKCHCGGAAYDPIDGVLLVMWFNDADEPTEYLWDGASWHEHVLPDVALKGPPRLTWDSEATTFVMYGPSGGSPECVDGPDDLFNTWRRTDDGWTMLDEECSHNAGSLDGVYFDPVAADIRGVNYSDGLSAWELADGSWRLLANYDGLSLDRHDVVCTNTGAFDPSLRLWAAYSKFHDLDASDSRTRVTTLAVFDGEWSEVQAAVHPRAQYAASMTGLPQDHGILFYGGYRNPDDTVGDTTYPYETWLLHLRRTETAHGCCATTGGAHRLSPPAVLLALLALVGIRRRRSVR